MYVPHERRALILRLLEQRGYLRTAALADELGVTEETIRTDFIALHERQLLSRVHGGARYIPPTGGAEDSARLDCQMADLILPHLSRGMLLYLDTGAPVHALLPRLAALACCIITPSPRLALAAALPALAPLRVILPGGSMDAAGQFIDFSPATAQNLFLSRQPDTALLFPTAIPAPDRIAYPNAARAQWAACAANAAKRTIIAAPAHAFYTQAEHSAPCSPSLLITEDNLPPGFESLPSELIPYLSPADIWQQDDIHIYNDHT